MARKVIGPTGSRRRRWLFLCTAAAAIATAALIIPGAFGSAPQLTGFFELDKNATHNLTTVHVGINQSNLTATATAIAVCEYSGTPALTAGATLMIDGEQMTFNSYAPGAPSTSTGGCSFTDPNITPTDVRTYNVTRGVNGTTAAKHAGDSDITQLISGTVAGNDWDQVFAHTSDSPPCSNSIFTYATASAVACSFVNDPPGVTIFTGGSSDIADINTWTCTNQSVPDADEILHAYAIKYSNSSQFLYFGADRYATNGSKDFGFWFFKNPISSSGTTISNSCPTGAFSGGLHSVGDILLLGTFTQGGSVSNIRAFKWVASGGDVSTHLLSEGTFGDCVPGSSSANACNTINNTSIPSPWSYQGKTAAGSGGAANIIYSGGFMEGGIDLGALNLGGCFSSFMAETRSSPSLTAELKDFTIGKFENCGSNLTTTPQLGDGSGLTADSNSNNLAEASIGTGSVSVRDSALLAVNGTPTFTGTLSFHICGPIASGTCSSGGVDETQTSNTVTANGTYYSKAVNLTSVGRYCWRSDFTSGTSGVPNASDSRAESSSGTGECFEVLPVTPSLTTTAVDCTPSHTAISAAVNFGVSICDRADLGSTTSTATQPGTNGGSDPGQSDNTYPSIGATNGAAAGGDILFTLKGPDTTSPSFVCSTTTAAISAGTNPEDNTSISGNNSYYTTGATPSSPGQYHWVAVYTPATGDPNNLGSTHNAACGNSAEAVTVQQVTPLLSTAQFVYPNDKAKITCSPASDCSSTGTGNLSGTVVFKLFDNVSDCQNHGSETVVGNNGLLYISSQSVSGAAPQTKSTSNSSAGVAGGSTVAWRVTYASSVTAQTDASPSACTEQTTVSTSGDDSTITVP